MAMKFFELVPSGTSIEFIKYRWRYIAISVFAVALTFLSMAYSYVTTGSILNFGIDFAGGSQIRLALDPEQDPGIEAVREELERLGYQGSSAVVVPDEEHEVLVRVKEVLSIDEASIERCRQAVESVPALAGDGTAKLLNFNHPDGGSKLFFKYDAEPEYKTIELKVNEAGCEGSADRGFGAKEGEFAVDFSLIGVGAKLREQFDSAFGAGTVTEIVRSETVGAKVGGQLKEDGAKALLYAVGFIFLYVMVRFDLRFAPGGIVALLHDAVLMVGAFSITGREFNLQTIAAVLTIIGYSINDTIVVFDRIRERVALNRDASLADTTNLALNDTLSRTLLTSGTTLIVVLSTYLMGSGAIKDFAFALLIGIVVGSYSSLYVATPVFLWVNKRFYGGEGHLRDLEKQNREGTGTLLGDPEKAEVQDGPMADPAEALARSIPPVPGTDAESDDDEAGDDEGPRRTRRRRRRPRPE